MAAGTVSEERAAVIVKGVDALPAEHRLKAETHQVCLARQLDPGSVHAGRREPGGPGAANYHGLLV